MVDNYAKQAIDAVRKLPADAQGVLLWEFPAEDFAAWAAMPDVPVARVKTYGDYLAVLAGMQADIERSGKIALRVKLSVAAVTSELAIQGLENNARNRTQVIGLLGAKQ